MRLVNAFIERLVREEVKCVFRLTGKAISPFINAALDYEEIEFVPARHESGAALAI